MAHPAAEFRGLVSSFAAGVSAALAQAESPVEADGGPTPAEKKLERSRQALDTARQLIDTLAMLEEKTKGNLTGEESGLLQSVLTELRVRYVQLTGAVKPAEG